MSIKATLINANFETENTVEADDIDKLRVEIEKHLLPAVGPGDAIEISDPNS